MRIEFIEPYLALHRETYAEGEAMALLANRLGAREVDSYEDSKFEEAMAPGGPGAAVTHVREPTDPQFRAPETLYIKTACQLE
jgi:hypothetical protein